MKVLINRSDNLSGSLLTSSMAARIKEDYPQAEIIYIVSPKSADLFKDHPFVDDIWILNNKSNVFRKINFIWGRMKKFSPDAFFHVEGSLIPAIIAWIMRLSFRGGLRSNWASFLLLNKGIHQMRSFVAQHEVDYNLNLLEELGIHYNYNKRSSYAPIITIDKKDINNNFIEFYTENNIETDDIIFIHPGVVGKTLNWSSRNYGRLIERLEEKFPKKFTYVISHTPADTPYLEGLNSFLKDEKKGELDEQVVFFDGSKKGLYHYMSILSKASLYVGPSTGTTHIANALGVKVVGLYSPIKIQSAMRWSPFDRSKDKARIIIPDVICGEEKKCAGRTCPYYECMGKIEVNDVFREIVDLGKFANV